MMHLLATSQAANSLRTIAFRGVVYKSDESSVLYHEKKYYFVQKSWIYYILKDSYMFASYKYRLRALFYNFHPL